MNRDSHDDDRPEAEVYRPPPGAPVWYQEDQDEISLVQLVNVLLRHRWKVLGIPALLAGVVAVYTVLQPTTYSASSTFMPQTGEGGRGGQLSRLSGVAAQFGINVPSGQAGQSPQFYADLIRSRRLLEEAALSKYSRRSEKDSGDPSARDGPDASDSPGADSTVSRSDSPGATLVEMYGIRGRSRSVAVAAAVSRLRDGLSVSANVETGVVEVTVATPWPAVSKQVADRVIELVNQFDSQIRQSQASAQAEFVRGRLQEARQELRSAEDSLERFLRRNVGWQQSPELRFRHDRLERRVQLKQQVYTSLASRYEEARIREVRSTPVVTTISEPRVPLSPDSNRLQLKIIVALLVGGLIGLVWSFGSEFTQSVREENAEEYREFEALKQDAAEDVKEAGRRIRRLLESGPVRGEE